jgi:hypothetical protein
MAMLLRDLGRAAAFLSSVGTGVALDDAPE